MCGGSGSTPRPQPETEPSNLILENSKRRRARRKGATGEGTGRKSLRIDLNPNAGPLSALRIPTGAAGGVLPTAP